MPQALYIRVWGMLIVAETINIHARSLCEVHPKYNSIKNCPFDWRPFDWHFSFSEYETAVASHEIAVPAYGYSYLATVLAIPTSVLVVASAGSAVFLLLF